MHTKRHTSYTQVISRIAYKLFARCIQNGTQSACKLVAELRTSGSQDTYKMRTSYTQVVSKGAYKLLARCTQSAHKLRTSCQQICIQAARKSRASYWQSCIQVARKLSTESHTICTQVARKSHSGWTQAGTNLDTNGSHLERRKLTTSTKRVHEQLTSCILTVASHWHRIKAHASGAFRVVIDTRTTGENWSLRVKALIFPSQYSLGFREGRSPTHTSDNSATILVRCADKRIVG